MHRVQRGFADGGSGLNGRQSKPQSRAAAGLLGYVTDNRNTRFFGGSNGRKFTTEDTEAHRGIRGFPRAFQGSRGVEILTLPAELDRDARSGGDVGSGGGGLLAGYAASDSLEFQAGVLRGLDCRAHGLAYE